MLSVFKTNENSPCNCPTCRFVFCCLVTRLCEISNPFCIPNTLIILNNSELRAKFSLYKVVTSRKLCWRGWKKKPDVEKIIKLTLLLSTSLTVTLTRLDLRDLKSREKKRSEKIKNAKFSIILHLSFPSTRSLLTGKRAHISVDWGDPYIELNSTSVAYISELLKDISMFLTLLNISACCSVRFYFVMVNLMQK